MSACAWRSGQNWTDGVGRSVERGLVVAAVAAAQRIARTPFWRGGEIGGRRAHLDLSRELDTIDVAAHRIASSGGAAQHGEQWAPLLERVVTLTAYANQVDGFEHGRDAAVMAPQGAPAPSQDEVVALLTHLGAVGTG